MLVALLRYLHWNIFYGDMATNTLPNVLQITKMGARAAARTLEEMVEGGRCKIEQRLKAQRDAAEQEMLTELTFKPERAATKASYPQVAMLDTVVPYLINDTINAHYGLCFILWKCWRPGIYPETMTHTVCTLQYWMAVHSTGWLLLDDCLTRPVPYYSSVHG